MRSKLSASPKYLEDYDGVIKNQLSEGVIEKVNDVIKCNSVCYLLHKEVIREDKTWTKLRVVFDASAKSSGFSLNESMYKGPCFTPLLFEVLVRFRLRVPYRAKLFRAKFSSGGILITKRKIRHFRRRKIRNLSYFMPTQYNLYISAPFEKLFV